MTILLIDNDLSL